MKKLGTQAYALGAVSLSVLVLLMVQLAQTLIEDRSFAKKYALKNKLAHSLNEAARWRAIERGLGATIDGTSPDLTTTLGRAFQESCDKTDIEIANALSYSDELLDSYPDPVLTRHVDSWRESIQGIEADRERIRTGQISKTEWISDVSDNIQDGFSLRNYALAPTGREDHIIHLNTVLSPNITMLSEFAGRERAIIGDAITSGRPLSVESLQNIERFRSVVEECAKQTALLVELPSTTRPMRDAILEFEKVFLGDFQSLREQIFAASADLDTRLNAARSRMDNKIAIAREFHARNISEVSAMSRHPSIVALAEALLVDREKLPANLLSTAEDYLGFHASLEKIYMKSRFLDARGMEQIRIDRRAGEISKLKKDALQDKSHRDYFTRAISCAPDEVYISDLDLNIEYGKVELPFTPTLRYTAPIHVKDEFAGAIVLSLSEDVLDSIVSGKATIGGSENQFLVDQDGFYLDHPDASKEWGMYEELGRSSHNLHQDYPGSASAILSGVTDSIQVKTGEFVVFGSIYYAGLQDKDRFWVVVENIDKVVYPIGNERWFEESTLAIDSALAISRTLSEQADTIMADVKLAADRKIVFFGVLLAIAALLSVLVLFWSKRSILRPIRSLTDATNAVAAGDFAQRVSPLARNELGELGESFNKMTADLQRSTQELREHRDRLDALVDERTAELNETNEKLVSEVAHHQRTEDRLAKSLAEKEVLLKEIHHRVKNNLQIISSLLNLQSVQIADEHTRELFSESKNRVSTMGLIHEKLYQSEDLAEIDFGDYLRSLVDALSESFGIRAEQVRLEVVVRNIFLDIDTAIPCALIVNELVSNAFKYAFRDDYPDTNGPPEIRIEMTRGDKNEIELRVSDNGRGLPDDLDFRDTSSLGLQIVITLTEQLNGVIELDNKDGAVFALRFEAASKEVDTG